MEKQGKRARVDPGNNHMLQKLRRLQADGEHQGSAQTSDQRDDSVSGGEPPGVFLAMPCGFTYEPGPEVQTWASRTAPRSRVLRSYTCLMKFMYVHNTDMATLSFPHQGKPGVRCRGPVLETSFIVAPMIDQPALMHGLNVLPKQSDSVCTSTRLCGGRSRRRAGAALQQGAGTPSACCP